MTEYKNIEEPNVKGFGIYEDEITIELTEEHEYRFYLITKNIIGGESFRTLCHAARSGHGLQKQFEKHKGSAIDK